MKRRRAIFPAAKTHACALRGAFEEENGLADARPIGVFDSGLGGLTVVNELIRRLPHENFVYFGDTGRVPYGNRSRETIAKYAAEDAAFLMRCGVKLVVAACGTVSSIAPETGDRLPVPFVEMVSGGAVAALRETRSGKIGVLGTAATVASRAYERQILAQRPTAQVTANACPLFVPLVEAGVTDRFDPVVREIARRYLAPLHAAEVDTVILGCTHYPILADVLRDGLGDGVRLVNVGAEAAVAVEAVLRSRSLENPQETPGRCRLCVSDRVASFSELASRLLGAPVDAAEIELVDLDRL